MSLSLAGSGQITGFDPVASGFGGLVAVKHVLKTNTFSASSVSAGANVAVDDLEIKHEVVDPANRLIITAYFGVAANSNGGGEVGIVVAEDGTLLALGDAEGSVARTTAGGSLAAPSGGVRNSVNPTFTFVHTPGSGEKTYTVRAINTVSAARNIFINRLQDTTLDQSRTRATSALVIQEVAV